MSDEWPDEADLDLAEREQWDRMAGESTKHYSAFRIYRDTEPLKRKFDAVAAATSMSESWCRDAAKHWLWEERAEAWDDACHRIEDRERLEAIRSMHKVHRSAGRMAVAKAMTALQQLPLEEMNAGHIARLLALGAKLERDTLIVSVEELQGIEEITEEEVDPWEELQRELTPDADL